MTFSPRDEVAKLIVRRDRAFRDVVKSAGPPPTRRSARVDDRFAYLVRSIVFQLLATSAASTIHERVQDVCGGDVSVQSILSTGPVRLKSAGLSRTKADAMVDLATHVHRGAIRLHHHGRMSDDDVINELTSVRGIGPWTAQMYLMHTLGRSDVWPVGDYGVRNGWSLVHGLDDIVSPVELEQAGAKFEGVRSEVAWYCWQAVHFHRSAK